MVSRNKLFWVFYRQGVLYTLFWAKMAWDSMAWDPIAWDLYQATVPQQFALVLSNLVPISFSSFRVIGGSA